MMVPHSLQSYDWYEFAKEKDKDWTWRMLEVVRYLASIGTPAEVIAWVINNAETLSQQQLVQRESDKADIIND